MQAGRWLVLVSVLNSNDHLNGIGDMVRNVSWASDGSWKFFSQDIGRNQISHKRRVL